MLSSKDLVGSTIKKEEATEKKPYKIGASDKQNEYLHYAWMISKNEDFIYTLLAENGQVNHDRKHTVSYWRCHSWKNGVTIKGKWYGNVIDKSYCQLPEPKGYWRLGNDWGFCGTSDSYQPIVRYDDRFMKDPGWQLDQCWNFFRNGTRIYGKDKINETKNQVVWK